MTKNNTVTAFLKNEKEIAGHQDPCDMDQDSKYINEAAYPNSAIITKGKHAMWMSMFTRHVQPSCDDDDDDDDDDEI